MPRCTLEPNLFGPCDRALMHRSAPPDLCSPTQEIEDLKEQVRKLEAINAALMDRVERSADVHGGAFSIFENAVTL